MMLRTIDTLRLCEKLAVEAGRRIMEYHPKKVGVSHKNDSSPVTEADLAAHCLITEGLVGHFPGIVTISEENEDFPVIGKEEFWLIDPLDGTKGFLRGDAEFTVNIALIEKGEPVLGVIYVPAKEELYSGLVGKGAWKNSDQKIAIRPARDRKITAVVSRYHPNKHDSEFLAQHAVTDTVQVNSSYKFCILAEGKADIYPRMGPTMEWDTAAGHAIVVAAGGSMTNLDGSPFRYGKPGFENPGFIARGA